MRLLAIVVCLLGGCRFIEPEAATKTLLARPVPTTDAVWLEVFSARFPQADARINREMWGQIDEQHLPADVRRRLAENGLRAGLVGTQLPPALAELLKLSDKPAEQTQVPLSSLEAEPKVTLRVLQTQSGKRYEVLTSRTHEQLSVLLAGAAGVGGRTFPQADGRFALCAFAQPDGRARLELVPEIHHGQQQLRWVGDEGVLRGEPGRPRQAFEDLRVKCLLAPGQMLVVTSLPERSGSLGHALFADEDGGRATQKLLVLRLAKAAPDRAFGDSDEARPMDLNVVAQQ
jgi:hypothetical protein